MNQGASACATRDTVPNALPGEDTTIYTQVDSLAFYPGGTRLWNEHLRAMLQKNTGGLIQDGKSGTCEFQFVVNKDGTLSNVEAVTMKDSYLAKIIVEFVRTGLPWYPAQYRGHFVRSLKKQKVAYQVPDN
jgi:periplasmic protein TonB